MAAAASNLKSISTLVISLKRYTVSINLNLLVLGRNNSAIFASNIKASNSSLNFFSMPGRKILIATSFVSPSAFKTLAKWTCAMEAAATGSVMSLILLKFSIPISFFRISFASYIENGGSLS